MSRAQKSVLLWYMHMKDLVMIGQDESLEVFGFLHSQDSSRLLVNLIAMHYLITVSPMDVEGCKQVLKILDSKAIPPWLFEHSEQTLSLFLFLWVHGLPKTNTV
jgi:hypothetical protein